MSLPVFDTPIHSITLPSTGETVQFRPFLVKEQKQLLMAANGDLDQQNTAIEQVIAACTFNKVDARKLASFDVEYLFMQIRAHSVGENVDLVLTCGCGAKTNSKLDVTAVKVIKDDAHTNTIELGSGLIVKMRYPRLREVENLALNQNVDGIINLIATSIDSIWKGDEMFASTDYTVAELIEFVENLSPQSLEKIEEFFSTMPVLRHSMNWNCKECSADNQVTLEGIQSFFG